MEFNLVIDNTIPSNSVHIKSGSKLLAKIINIGSSEELERKSAMLNIYDVLRDYNARISIGDRWLVFDDEDGWTVFSRPPYAKKAKVLYEGPRESDAINALLKR